MSAEGEEAVEADTEASVTQAQTQEGGEPMFQTAVAASTASGMSRLIKTLFGFYPVLFLRRRRRGALRHHQLHRRDLPSERPADY